MTRVSRLAALAALGVMAGCAHVRPEGAGTPPPGGWETSLRRDHPLVGRIWGVHEGRFVTPAELLAALAPARYVLLGEKHDNPDAHALQTWALSGLLSAGRKPALVFEQVRRDEQPTLESFTGKPASAAKALGAALHWSDSGWPPFEQYEPLFALALQDRLPLIAGDLGRSDLEKLRKQDLAAFDAADQHRLGIDQPPTDEQRQRLVDELRASHCGMGNDAMFARMVGVQWARDAQLASAMVDGAGRADGAVLISGAGHARLDRGAPIHLARFDPGALVRSVSFLEVVNGVESVKAYLETEGNDMPFDYLYFTPRLDENDPCEQLRGRK